tara:strand:- start:379 stop:642 length:264 start_codon:yes stop_codon:yes gene_type:complete
MIEAWQRRQMSNLGCESVSDLIAEVKRLQQLIVDAAWQIHWAETTTATHMESNEWDESIHAPAQQWRKQVQDILDASDCPWKESEEE